LRDSDDVRLDESFSRRYPQIPEGYVKFLQKVASCVNPAETVWFLCVDDYNGMSKSEWAWNEMEKIDLEGAQGDEQATAQIVEFWNHHLPFMYSVSGDYAYLALRVTGDSYGSVVDGYDIDLTTASDVAPTFEEFVRLHRAALKGDFGDTVLGDYV
jgi:SMI1 / KNR4 family (SUKH-1)